MMKRFGILRETGTAIANTGMQKTLADSFIKTHSLCNLFYVCTNGLTKVRNLIHVGNFKCKEVI